MGLPREHRVRGRLRPQTGFASGIVMTTAGKSAVCLHIRRLYLWMKRSIGANGENRADAMAAPPGRNQTVGSAAQVKCSPLSRRIDPGGNKTPAGTGIYGADHVARASSRRSRAQASSKALERAEKLVEQRQQLRLAACPCRQGGAHSARAFRDTLHDPPRHALHRGGRGQSWCAHLSYIKPH